MNNGWKKGSAPNPGQQKNVPNLVMLARIMKMMMKMRFAKIFFCKNNVKIFSRRDFALDHF